MTEMKMGERRRGGDDVARCAKGAIRMEKKFGKSQLPRTFYAKPATISTIA
jgi:hypothetical protein